MVDVFRYKDINLQSTACMLFQFKMLPWKKNCMTIHRVFGGGRNSWGGGEGRYSFMGGRGDEIYFPQQTPQSPTTTHTTFVRFFFFFFIQDELCESFGQHEQLTTRINRLLEGYTRDASIFKELLQNADDAGATEVCHLVFVFRHRICP